MHLIPKLLCLILALGFFVRTECAVYETVSQVSSTSNAFSGLTAKTSVSDIGLDGNRSSIRDRLQEFIELALRHIFNTVTNGGLSLPSMDPLVIESLGPYRIGVLGVQMTGSMENVRFEGLSEFGVESLSWSTLRQTLNLVISVPTFVATGTYDVESRLLLVSHNAGGDFRIVVDQLQLSIDARLGTSLLGGHFTLRELDIVVSIDNISINIEGMTGSETLNASINSYIENITQEIIENRLEALSQYLSERLFDVFNNILAGFTRDELLNIINAINGNGNGQDNRV